MPRAFIAVPAVAAVTAVYFGAVDHFHRFFWWLDGANLVIHEAGHPIFSLLFLGNRFMMFVGGTAFQLLMPAAFVIHFLREGQRRSADACLFWFGENFLHIAPYIADARAQALPLVGGGEHDWNYLLGVFGLLNQDTFLGGCCNLLGCLIMAVSIYLLCVHSTDAGESLAAQQAQPANGGF